MKTSALIVLFLFLSFLCLVNACPLFGWQPFKAPVATLQLSGAKYNPDTCIAVPSAFTPNNDGKNDKIGPIENGCKIRALLFRIYNRQGQVVFISEYIGNDWDGTVNGATQEAGYYPYICYYTPEGGINKMFTGTITLIR